MGCAHIINGLAGQSKRFHMVGDAAPKDRQVGRYIKTVNLQRRNFTHIGSPIGKNNHAQGIGSQEKSMRQNIHMFDLAQYPVDPLQATQ
jgi:hypothetical protein